MDIRPLFYKTSLGKSLKHSLHKFDKEELFTDIKKARKFYIMAMSDMESEISRYGYYRVKAMASCEIKYDRYFPNYAVERVYNDIFGARIIVEDYGEAEGLVDNMSPSRVSDMIAGKKSDDGYRGLHLYYQPDHFTYPIEFQFNTAHDRVFNNWAHTWMYKKGYPAEIGGALRAMYESGRIQTENDFRREFYGLLSGK